jgi:hypothetical protein
MFLQLSSVRARLINQILDKLSQNAGGSRGSLNFLFFFEVGVSLCTTGFCSVCTRLRRFKRDGSGIEYSSMT